MSALSRRDDGVCRIFQAIAAAAQEGVVQQHVGQFCGKPGIRHLNRASTACAPVARRAHWLVAIGNELLGYQGHAVVDFADEAHLSGPSIPRTLFSFMVFGLDENDSAAGQTLVSAQCPPSRDACATNRSGILLSWANRQECWNCGLAARFRGILNEGGSCHLIGVIFE